LNGESARLAERQRLLVATAQVQRLRMACHWRALSQAVQPAAMATSAIAALRREGRWLALLAPLWFVLALRARRHGHHAGAPSLRDAFVLARWALRWLRGGPP
jgi:hypothetical protein